MSKLFVRTIRICSGIFCGSVFFSILFAVISNDSQICTILVNYSIGIACSSLLVVVPIVLQYLSEKERINKEIESAILYLIIYWGQGVTRDLNISQYKHIWSEIENCFQKIYVCLSQSAYFTKGQSKKHFANIKDLLKEYIEFAQTNSIDDMEIIRYIEDYDRFMGLANSALKILKNDFDKSIIQKTINIVENEHIVKVKGDLHDQL